MPQSAITDVDLYINEAIAGDAGCIYQALSASLCTEVKWAFTYCFFQRQIPFHLEYGAGDFSYRKGWGSSNFQKLLLLKTNVS